MLRSLTQPRRYRFGTREICDMVAHAEVETIFRQVTFGARAQPRVAGLKRRLPGFGFDGAAASYSDAISRMKRIVYGKKLPNKRQTIMLRDMEKLLAPYLALVFPIQASVRTRPSVRLMFDEATGVGLYAAKRLKKGHIIVLAAKWSRSDAVTKGLPVLDPRRKRRGTCRDRKVLKGYRNTQRSLSCLTRGESCVMRRQASQSEAYQVNGACERILVLSGPASYINDGCAKCANLVAVDGTFTKWRCTRAVDCGTELRMQYNLDLNGTARCTEIQDTLGEYICC